MATNQGASSSDSTAHFDCRILRIIDGDTVDLACPGEARERTRLVGFDTPEKTDPKCEAELRRARLAERYLKSLLDAAEVLEVRRLGLDRYDRRLAVVTLDGTDLARLMVSSGHARAYTGGQRLGWCA